MSYLTVVHKRDHITLQCSNDCVCQNGVWLVPCTDPICNLTGNYIKGKAKPNYPVPAIPLEVNNFGDWIDIRQKYYKKRVRSFYKV